MEGGAGCIEETQRGATPHEIEEVVAHQAKAGIDIVNDGEFGKSGWANYILERMSGFEPRPNKLYEACLARGATASASPTS